MIPAAFYRTLAAGVNIRIRSTKRPGIMDLVLPASYTGFRPFLISAAPTKNSRRASTWPK